MSDPTRSLSQKILTLIDATPWGDGAEQTFVKTIWPQLEHDYDRMISELRKICEKIISDKGIPGMVEGRVKTGDSIDKSLHRRRLYRLEHCQPECNNFSELLSEIHDLAGIRIVVDLPGHLQAASNFINDNEIFHQAKPANNFKADRSIGTFWRPWFGAYECVNHHVTANFPANHFLQYYNGVLLEIQVTNLAASLYNKIAHPLHYKNEAGELSRGDEIVIDLTRGLALCYSLCLYYKHEKLDTEEIDFMRRQVSIEQAHEDPEIMLPDMPELRNTTVKEIPASILQQTLEKLSSSHRGANESGAWRSFMRNLSPAIQLIDIRNKAISKLPFDQMDSREISIEIADGDTCHWILDVPEYQSWEGTEDTSPVPPIFWIKGKAGAGKSTAMKFLARKKREGDACDTVLSFFFNARGTAEERTTIGLYRALLYQLYRAEPDLCSSLDKLGNIYLKSVAEYGWHAESVLKEILRGAFRNRQSKRRLYCFIDALDECPEKQVRDMVDLFQGSINVRFCFASRPYPEISVHDCQQFLLDQAPGHREDIKAYVQHRLLKFKLDQKDLDALKEGILLKSSGIFMWVVLVLRILEEESDAGRCHSLLSFKQRLVEIPPDLNALFQNIVTRVGGVSERFLHTLQWILYAKCPLSPSELCAALCISEGEIEKVSEITTDPEVVRKTILSASRGLAEITESGQPTVQFIHESVKDFLLTDGKFDELQLGDNFEGQSHHDLATACSLRIGSISGIQSKEEAKTLPLYQYASESVFYHADNAQRCGVNQERFLLNFPLQTWRLYKCLPYRNSSDINRSDNSTLLHCLAEHGAEHLIPLCPGRASHLKFAMRGGEYNYGVFAAARCGNYGSLCALFGLNTSENLKVLELGRNLRERSVFRNWERRPFVAPCCGIPMILAFGDCQLVRQILDSHQYDPPCTEDGLDTGLFFRFALSEEMLDLWFEFSETLNLLGSHSFMKHYNTVPTTERGYGLATLVQHWNRCYTKLCEKVLGQSILLSTTGTDSEHVQGYGGLGLLTTPIWFLYNNPWGHSKLREQQPDGPYTIFSMRSGELKHLQEAIERCPQLLSSQVWSGKHWLHYALDKGFRRLITMCVSQIIRTKDALGSATTAIASVTTSSRDFEMSSAIIGLLLDSSFILDGQILLLHAARSSNLPMVKSLLQDFARIDVNLNDDQGQTILHGVLDEYPYIHYDRVQIIRELLGAGADLNAICSNGGTALHYAAGNESITGHLAFIRLVLEIQPEISIDARDHRDRTALFLAILNGNHESVSTLLRVGASFGNKDLEFCIEWNEVDIFKTLLSAHPNPNVDELLKRCIEWDRLDIINAVLSDNLNRDVYWLLKETFSLSKHTFVNILLGLSKYRDTITPKLLREIILGAKEGSYGEIGSGEALRIVLNKMRSVDGNLPTREILPFEEAKQRGRKDMVLMMEAFLRDGELLKPYDKYAHIKCLWTGRY